MLSRFRQIFIEIVYVCKAIVSSIKFTIFFVSVGPSVCFFRVCLVISSHQRDTLEMERKKNVAPNELID